MYCLSIVTGIECVANELNMWTDISSEHPIFLKTVAELTNKKLPLEIISRLDHMSNAFSTLNRRLNRYYGQFNIVSHYMNPSVRYTTIDFLNDFLQLDKEMISLLKDLKNYGVEDKVWQTLVEHITHEQKYMYRLFSCLLNQIRQ